MPGAKRKEHEIVDLYKEFVRTEVARQVIRNETALLQLLENLAGCSGWVRDVIGESYFRIHKNSLLADQDFEALGRMCEVLNVVSGRAAIRPDE